MAAAAVACAAAALAAHTADSSDDPATLFFSAQLGRLSNCMLSVNAARFVASSLSLRLAVPPCRTSPYGEQACAPHLNIPDQRQSLVEFELLRALGGASLHPVRGGDEAVVVLLLGAVVRDLLLHKVDRARELLDRRGSHPG